MWIADGKIMDAEKAFYSKANCNTLIPDEVGLDGGSHCVDHRCEGTDRRSRVHRHPDQRRLRSRLLRPIEQVHDVTRNLVAVLPLQRGET